MGNLPPGFRPINFRLAGKILFSIGAIVFLAYLIGIRTNAFGVPRILLYFASALIVIGVYLILLVKRN